MKIGVIIIRKNDVLNMPNFLPVTFFTKNMCNNELGIPLKTLRKIAKKKELKDQEKRLFSNKNDDPQKINKTFFVEFYKKIGQNELNFLQYVQNFLGFC